VLRRKGGKLQQESIANHRLHHKRVLEVPDAVAVPGLSLLDVWRKKQIRAGLKRRHLTGHAV